MESSIAVFLMRQLACEQLPTKIRLSSSRRGSSSRFTVSHVCVCVHSQVGHADNVACVFGGLRNGLSAGHTFSAFWL
jgi:hypothetical protein